MKSQFPWRRCSKVENGYARSRKRVQWQRTANSLPFTTTISNCDGNVRIYNWWHVMGFSPAKPGQRFISRGRFFIHCRRFPTGRKVSAPRLSFVARWRGGRRKCISPLLSTTVDKREISSWKYFFCFFRRLLEKSSETTNTISRYEYSLPRRKHCNLLVEIFYEYVACFIRNILTFYYVGEVSNKCESVRGRYRLVSVSVCTRTME